MNRNKLGLFIKNCSNAAIVSGVLGFTPAYALNNAEAQLALDSALGYLETEQQIADGGWGNSEALRYVTTASVVEALSASNNYSTSYYAGVAWLENHAATNVDFISRKIKTLAKRGNNLDYELAYLDDARYQTSDKGIGLNSIYTASPLDSALALQAVIKAEDGSNQTLLTQYLISSQLGDGGWSLGDPDISNYWVTAEALLALGALETTISTEATSISNALTLLNTLPTSEDNALLARAALAVYKQSGLSSEVDNWVTTLLARQSVGGDWGDSYTTALVVHALAAVTGSANVDDALRVSVTNQTLRALINQQLGKNAFDSLTRGELARISALDLRGFDISELTGLEFAINLVWLNVDSDTDLSAIAGLTAVTVVVESSDTDLDGMDNEWEILYGLNPDDPTDATADPDSDELLNIDEYTYHTNPKDPDTDGDEIPDGFEVAYGLDPLYHDAGENPDNDKLTNLEEYAAGTDPKDRDTDNDALFDGIDSAPLQYDAWLIPSISTLL